MLPVRLDDHPADLPGLAGDAEVCAEAEGQVPALRCALRGPVASELCLLVRVLSRAGIPLASAQVTVRPGDTTFETPRLTMLAMEGYAHLKLAERQAVERRVWSRRAYVTVSAA